MTVMGEGLLIEEISELIMSELTETMSYCDECEAQVNDFIKIANCILNREEFYDLLNKYRKFESNFSVLETLSAQIDFPLSVLQAVTLKATMKELKKDFDQLIEIMEISNNRIDDNDINFSMARLIQRLLKMIAFEAIEYDGLQQAMESTILVLDVVNMFDENYPTDYFPFSVLKIVSCKDKISAYEYALKNGIRRDYVINRYGAHFT